MYWLSGQASDAEWHFQEQVAFCYWIQLSDEVTIPIVRGACHCHWPSVDRTGDSCSLIMKPMNVCSPHARGKASNILHRHSQGIGQAGL